MCVFRLLTLVQSQKHDGVKEEDPAGKTHMPDNKGSDSRGSSDKPSGEKPSGYKPTDDKKGE